MGMPDTPDERPVFCGNMTHSLPPNPNDAIACGAQRLNSDVDAEDNLDELAKVAAPAGLSNGVAESTVPGAVVTIESVPGRHGMSHVVVFSTSLK
jgi:hypothetical protein